MSSRRGTTSQTTLRWLAGIVVTVAVLLGCTATQKSNEASRARPDASASVGDRSNGDTNGDQPNGDQPNGDQRQDDQLQFDATIPVGIEESDTEALPPPTTVDTRLPPGPGGTIDAVARGSAPQPTAISGGPDESPVVSGLSRTVTSIASSVTAVTAPISKATSNLATTSVVPTTSKPSSTTLPARVTSSVAVLLPRTTLPLPKVPLPKVVARELRTDPLTKPERIRVKALGINAGIEPVGLNSQRALSVPSDVHVPGWWKGGRVPGEAGPTVIVGHVDSKRGPGVFAKLDRLTEGDRIELESDGTTYTYEVDRVERHPKKKFPTDDVYGSTVGSTLRLITCGGDFNSKTGHYFDNVIAFANLVDSSK